MYTYCIVIFPLITIPIRNNRAGDSFLSCIEWYIIRKPVFCYVYCKLLYFHFNQFLLKSHKHFGSDRRNSNLGPISPSEYIPEYIPLKYSRNTVLYDQGNISSRYSCSGSSIGRARAVTEPVVASSSLVVVTFLSAGDNSPTDPLFSMLFAKSDARKVYYSLLKWIDIGENSLGETMNYY